MRHWLIERHAILMLLLRRAFAIATLRHMPPAYCLCRYADYYIFTPLRHYDKLICAIFERDMPALFSRLRRER